MGAKSRRLCERSDPGSNNNNPTRAAAATSPGEQPDPGTRSDPTLDPVGSRAIPRDHAAQLLEAGDVRSMVHAHPVRSRREHRAAVAGDPALLRVAMVGPERLEPGESPRCARSLARGQRRCAATTCRSLPSSSRACTATRSPLRRGPSRSSPAPSRTRAPRAPASRPRPRGSRARSSSPSSRRCRPFEPRQRGVERPDRGRGLGRHRPWFRPPSSPASVTVVARVRARSATRGARASPRRRGPSAARTRACSPAATVAP